MCIKSKALLISIISLLVVGIVVAVIVIGSNQGQPTVKTEQSSETESTITEAPETDVVVEPPKDESDDSSETEDEPVLTPVEEEPIEESKEEIACEPIAEPVTEVTPKVDKTDSGTTIVIGGNQPEPEQYHCGVSGHHCSSAEVHALISNYELDGCQYCGSHSCPSFYATDEWGQTCYDATKCPKYNIKSDPVYYCQDCGKKCGDGQNGTCAVYNIDIDCPYCGKHVKAWTCHSCK